MNEVFSSSGAKLKVENFSSYPIYTVLISSIFLVISWEQCSPLPHSVHACARHFDKYWKSAIYGKKMRKWGKRVSNGYIPVNPTVPLANVSLSTSSATITLARYNSKISIRPFTSGIGTFTLMSNLPGLVKALRNKFDKGTLHLCQIYQALWELWGTSLIRDHSHVCQIYHALQGPRKFFWSGGAKKVGA